MASAKVYVFPCFYLMNKTTQAVLWDSGRETPCFHKAHLIAQKRSNYVPQRVVATGFRSNKGWDQTGIFAGLLCEGWSWKHARGEKKDLNSFQVLIYIY